jgi:hypothetical protein
MVLGSEIRDPEKIHSGSRIQGSKRYRIPDPDPQHWYLVSTAQTSLDEKYRIVNVGAT